MLKTSTGLLRLAAVAAMTLAGLAVPAAANAATPAHASPNIVVVCDAGVTDIAINSWSYSNTVTHDKYFSVPSGATLETEDNVTKTASITATVTFNTSATASGSAVILKFSATVGATLQAVGSITYQSSETYHWTLGTGDYAVWSGDRKYTGAWSGTVCNSNGTVETPVSGAAISWAIPGTGAARCGTTYSTTSFNYKAAKYAC